MYKRFLIMIITVICLMCFVGCTSKDVKDTVTNTVNTVTNSNTYKNVLSYVKDKGLEISKSGCEKIQSYIEDKFGDVNITGISISTKKTYIVSFTDKDGKEQQVKFNSDFTTDLDE